MNATAEIPVGRLPEVWRLKVAGVTFTATADVRRNKKGFASVLVTILTDTPLVYVPCAVQNKFCADVAARVGRLPTWTRAWSWGRFKSRRNEHRYGQTPAEITKHTQEALEFVDGREELTVSANPRGGR
jgi:hypothetical protein